jgi:hypothetical protein
MSGCAWGRSPLHNGSRRSPGPIQAFLKLFELLRRDAHHANVANGVRVAKAEKDDPRLA